MNASGECSGAEAVLLDHIDLALAEGIEVVVACPPGPLVARLPTGVGHVPLPSFGLGAEGRIARVIATLGLVVRTVRTARILRPEARAADTHTVVNSLLALPAVRLARPATPVDLARARCRDLVGPAPVRDPRPRVAPSGWGWRSRCQRPRPVPCERCSPRSWSGPTA